MVWCVLIADGDASSMAALLLLLLLAGRFAFFFFLRPLGGGGSIPLAPIGGDSDVEYALVSVFGWSGDISSDVSLLVLDAGAEADADAAVCAADGPATVDDMSGQTGSSNGCAIATSSVMCCDSASSSQMPFECEYSASG